MIMSARRVVSVLLMATAGSAAPIDLRASAPIPPEVAADWRRQDRIRPDGGAPAAVATILAELQRHIERRTPSPDASPLPDTSPQPGQFNARQTVPGPAHASAANVHARNELRKQYERLRLQLAELKGVDPADPRWPALYLDACVHRRQARLERVQAQAPRIIFTRHYDLGGSFYAYTEGQSDAQNERVFVPGASLCLLSMDGVWGRVETLIDAPEGVIRDPDVSWDAGRVLFSWKKSDRDDDYHLYELDMATRKVRQLTDGLGFVDYEGIYAPNGDIIFNSTRCVQTVDCWWTEVSNLYTCSADGKYLRRLAFDQVHDNYPTVTHDGRVIYTRWDYNDRSQMYPQGLFQMMPDGTGQTETYGNNSWFPTSILHARAIPGTGKYVAIFSGHHTLQKGWLGLLDPARGRQENAGAQLIAPVRETEAVRVDFYGQDGDQFQYPYPLSESEFLVTFKPAGSDRPFAVYWIDADGRRELLAWDAHISCNQPVPLAPRPVPPVRPSQIDYRRDEGTCYLQDVYVGPGLNGVERGTVKKLRVVALSYRAAGIAHNCNKGPAGEALVCTPIAIGNGSWDTKTVLGEATVHEDGSAMFAVPARTPVYFQAVDERGYVVQTMRSWATLQPGERASCVGCHESKNAAPPSTSGPSMAMKAGVQKLEGFWGPPRGFSFRQEIQPILDRHCVKCHHERRPAIWRAASVGADRHTDASAREEGGEGESAFSLLADEVIDPVARRKWSESYLALTHVEPLTSLDCQDAWSGHPDEVVNWISAQSEPSMLPPYSAGAARSRLMKMMEGGHGGVQLSREEREKIACWIDLLVPYCGDYLEANAWSEEEVARYRHFAAKRERMEQQERKNIAEYLDARDRQDSDGADRTSDNHRPSTTTQ